MSNLFDFDPREDDEEESDFDPFETSSDDEEYLPEPGENDESSEYESDDDVVDNEPQQHETTCSEPKEFVLSKDGKYCYYFEPPPQLPNRSNASFALHETPGPTLFASSRCTDILSSFLLFMEPIEKTIVEMTNLYGSRKYKELWLPVDIASLRAYYGLLILAGVYRSHGQCINELWDDQTGPPIFRATMTLKKFKLINECIRFDDKEQRKGIRSRDKLAPIRNVYDKWVNRLKMCYTVGKNVTEDEQLVPFRGRCPFTQYIPSKPHKYGIKIWCLSDANWKYKKKKYRRRLYLVELGKELVTPYIANRKTRPRTPNANAVIDEIQNISSRSSSPTTSTSAAPTSATNASRKSNLPNSQKLTHAPSAGKRSRCAHCEYKNNKNLFSNRCDKCITYVCNAHHFKLCTNCIDKL
ncbi:unnamed protein product [Hermetia illucens]|uniref:PiggyBac transposable element-derived protein domain-containing protein n=1 Tax=Hermetia illucens TaxID=343691 RepID=A0A7R8UE61_HERIL|nr:unnamed protein product [Hermetia illucens]